MPLLSAERCPESATIKKQRIGDISLYAFFFAARTICSVENTNEMHRNEEIHA
jgi:hypothetical protein